MPTGEDIYIEADGKRVYFLQKYSNKADASAIETVTLAEMSTVHRAMVQSVPAVEVSGHVYATVVSGGCSGNAITVLWEATSGHSFTWASGYATSGYLLNIIAAGT